MSSGNAFPGEFQAGDVVGGTYLVLDYIGRGAMGYLYHVRHNMLGTEYALKTLSGEKVTELDWKRFQMEAQATATMNHPNIVMVHNSGLHERKLPFYVMDLLRGVDLSRKVRDEGALDPKLAARIFIDVCAGIGYAHKKGVIHRDIKPGNVYILDAPDPSGARVKVVDFGIAKLTVSKNQDVQSLTGVGDVVGTPYYMSPEQTMGSRVDARSDVYSLGCTLFEALTGVLPFRGRNPTEIMILHQTEPAPALSKVAGGKEFPYALEAIVAKSMAKEPSERYQTMDQMANDLAYFLESDRPAATSTFSGTLPGVQMNEEPPVRISQAMRLPPSLNDQYAPSGPDTIQKRKAQLKPILAGGAVALLLLGCGGFLYWQNLQQAEKQKQQVMAEQLKALSGPAANDTVATEKNDKQLDAMEEHLPSLVESELPAHQIPSAALYLKTPFSSIRTIDGEKKRCFEFPTDCTIGHLATGEPLKYVKANGQLIYPQYESIVFVPAEIVSRIPSCLKRFQPGDIYGVRMSAKADSDEVFSTMVNIPNVQKLDFTESSHLGEKSVTTLKHFPSLKVFVGSALSNTDGEALAQVDRFTQIDQLYLPRAQRVINILKKIAPTKNIARLGIGPANMHTPEYEVIASLNRLNYLEITGNHLSDKDVALLGSLHKLNELKLFNTTLSPSALQIIKNFKGLTFLGLNGNRLTADDLKVLLPLQSLTGLEVRETGLDASAIPVLKKFAALKELRISSRMLSPEDLNKIKTALPGVTVL